MLAAQKPLVADSNARRAVAVTGLRAAGASRPLRGLRVRAVAEPLAHPGNSNGGGPQQQNGTAAVPINSGALSLAPVAQPVINIPEPIPGVFPPAAAYAKVCDGGAAKAALPWQKVLVMGVLAGFYIGFGGLLSLIVGGNSPGRLGYQGACACGQRTAASVRFESHA